MKKNTTVALRPGMTIYQFVSGVGQIAFKIDSVWEVKPGNGALAGTWFSLSAPGYDARQYCIPSKRP